MSDRSLSLVSPGLLSTLKSKQIHPNVVFLVPLAGSPRAIYTNHCHVVYSFGPAMRDSILSADIGRIRLHASGSSISQHNVHKTAPTEYTEYTTQMTRIGWVCLHCFATPCTQRSRANTQSSTALGRWASQWPTISNAILWPKRSLVYCTPTVHCPGEIPFRRWVGRQRAVLKRLSGSVGLFSPWY